MTKQCDVVIDNVRIASMQKNGNTYDNTYGILTESSVAIKNAKVLAIFDASEESYESTQKYDGENKWLLPGFIDCHTLDKPDRQKYEIYLQTTDGIWICLIVDMVMKGSTE